MYAQGYFAYDSKKSGGVTISHLRFGSSPIKSTYLIDQADFVSCSMQSYVTQYDMITDVKKGGTFLLNTVWSPEELEENLPAKMKKYISENDVNFYTINATKVAQEIGLGRRTNMILQAAFFKLSNVIPYKDAEKYLKDAVVKSYGKKGEKVVNMNNAAIDNAISSLHKVEVPKSWANAKDAPAAAVAEPDFIKNVLRPMNAQKGDELPVSVFTGREDGSFPAGTSAYEKRCIAVDVPEWQSENCIQCAQCAFVCPHACIRPVLVKADEKAKAPSSFKSIKAIGK
jgi:pyruvate-ferredoxin/flavodoxin oxidoreductase